MKYEVIVGNVGTVYSGDKHYEAMHHYNDAVYRSRNSMGRMAGEPVYMMQDGEPIEEYQGQIAVDTSNEDGTLKYFNERSKR